MRALVIDQPDHASVRDLTVAPPGPRDVIVEVKACGFCGTDLHIFRGEYLGDYPVIPGHEASAVVSGVGSEITEFRIGDRVAIEPNILCGKCFFCRTGRGNFCENWTAIGVTLPGCMAQEVRAPVSQVFAIGELPFEVAAFMEPLSCVLHGMSKLAPLDDEDVLILGAGPIGLLLMQVAKRRGAKRITVTDLRPGRLALARRLGADRIVDSDTEPEALLPESFDVVIDATGNPNVIQLTVEWVRPGGKVLWFGVAPRGKTVPVEPFAVFRKGLSIHSAYTSLGNSAEAIALLASGEVRVEPLISHRLPLEEFQRAATLLQSDPDVLKVVMIP